MITLIILPRIGSSIVFGNFIRELVDGRREESSKKIVEVLYIVLMQYLCL